MKPSTTLSTTASSLASKFTLAVMSVGLAAALGFAAEKPQPLLDRFGDPLPDGTIRRFGTLRFRHPGISELAFTPDGKELIAGGRGNPLLVFDAATGRKLREIGNDNPQSQALMGFALSPNSKQVACCGSDVSVSDLATGRLIRQFSFNDHYQEVVFSPNGMKIAAINEEQGRDAYQIRIVIGEIATGRLAAISPLTEGKPLSFSFRGLAYAPDGKYLAGCFSELREEKPFVHSAVSSQVWLLDPATGKRVRTFGSVDVPVVCFAFQPGSGRLATYGKDGILRFWDVESEKEVQRFQAAKGGEGNGFGILRFSADGGRCALLTNGAKYLMVLDTKDGRVLRRIEREESRYKVAIALSGDGKTIASSGLLYETCVHVWDAASGVERLADAGHRAAPNALSLSSDDRTLISRDNRGREIHWDRQTAEGAIGKAVAREVGGDFIWSSDFSQKDLRGPRWRLVYRNQWPAMMEVRSPDGTKLIRKMETHGHLVPTVALSPDGTQLAIAARNVNDANSTLMLWDPERDEKPRRLPGNPYGNSQLLFSHDGKRLIGGGGLGNPRFSIGNLWIWDVATAQVIRKLPINTAPGRLLLTADDRVLLICGLGDDATVHAWEIETGTELARMTDPSLKPPSDNNNYRTQPAIAGLALSGDERFLAVVSSWGDVSAVSIWETGSWKLIRTFAPVSPRNDVKAMVFSRDGRSLFVANSDSTILEWDVTGRFGHKRETPNRERLSVLWRTLTATPDKANPAVWEMLDHPAQSVPFLKDKISPVQPEEEKRVQHLLARLDSDSFVEREEASRQLRSLGQQFLPMLRKTLNDRPPLETKRRLEGIVESLGRGASPEQLRMLRALAVLEWSDSRESGEHLRRLADGAPSAFLTEAAKAAWQRRQEKSLGRSPSRKKK